MPDLIPSLHELGGLAKFAAWRPQQADAIARAVDSPSRFVALCKPTGSGKSATAVGAAVMSGARAIYLCSTKGQQDQVLRDFETMGLVDVRGQENYKCVESKNFGIMSDISVSFGPCHAGVVCPSRNSSCTYYKAVREARQSQLVVTNYTYWILQNIFGDGLGNFDLMVCDEAHAAVEEICGVLATIIHKHEVEAILNSAFPRIHAKLDYWKNWAAALASKLERQINDMKQEIQTLTAEGEYDAAHQLGKRWKERRDLKRRLDLLSGAKGDWVAELHGSSMQWDPVWPQEYSEQMLFWQIPRVLLMSATVRPKTLELLGLKPPQYEFIEYPSTFPLERRPVYRIPTVRLNKDSTPEDYRTWVTRIDQIIQRRLDRKGLIHTVSYKRAQLLLEKSEFRRRMISHTSRSTRQVVEAFRKSPTPLLLVSPSVDTGFDFPNDTCRFLIVGKLPWPDTRSAVMRARKDRDPDYMAYLTAQSLVQMCGRSVRSDTDWSEIFVVDDSFNWFVPRYKEFLPQWFLEAIRWVNTIPEPLNF